MSAAEAETALWVLGRGTGIAALALLTLSLCLGIVVRSRRTVADLPRYGITALHRTASLSATVLVATHVAALLLDPQAGLRVTDLVVPFAGEYRPFWLGLGTIAWELIAVVAASGLLRRHLGERAFRAAHATSYALWPVAVLHGLGSGTDAGRPWLLAATGISIAIVAGFAAWRVSADFTARPRRSVPARL